MATRFRLPASAAAAVSPAVQSYTHTATTRRPLPTATTGDSTALATQALTPDAADHIAAGDQLFVQFVSDLLSAQTIASGLTLKIALQCLEANAGNNLSLQIWLGLYNTAGTGLLATLRAKTTLAAELNTTIQNRSASTTTTAGYTCVGGERLVLEISVVGTPVATGGVQGHNASLRFGSNGAGGDLPEDQTSTGTTLNPWFELSQNLLFQTPVTFSAGAMAATSATTPAAGVTGAALVAAELLTVTADGPVAALTSTPPLELPPGAGDRYAAMNIMSPWRQLAVVPTTVAAAQRAAGLFLYSGLAAAPAAGFAAEVMAATASTPAAAVAGGTATAFAPASATAVAPVAAAVWGGALAAAALPATASALIVQIPTGEGLPAQVQEASAVFPVVELRGGAQLAFEPFMASAGALVLAVPVGAVLAAEVWGAAAPALPATVLSGAALPIEYTRVRPEIVAQGSRETLPWRFDLSALLGAGEVPVLPTATLVNLTTELAYPAGLLGPAALDSVYLTQWVTDLAPGMTYRLWVGVTILPAATRAWEMWLDIAVPPVGTEASALALSARTGGG